MISRANDAGFHADRLLAMVGAAGSPAADRPRVLVVDTDPLAAESLRRHLTVTGVDVLLATSVDDARAILATTPVSLTLFDPAVGGDAAWRFCSRLADYARASGMPLIATKRTGDPIPDVELYLLGIDAVLAPPAQQNELLALVRSYLTKLTGVRSGRFEDPVTGLPSIAMYRQAWDRAVSLALREREPLTLLVVHATRLHRVRYESGSEAAEGFLRRVVDGVAATLRQSDLLARGEGDTLLGLLPNTDLPGAERVIEKVHHRLQRLGVMAEAFELGVALESAAARAVEDGGLAATLGCALARLEPLQSALERTLAREEPMPARPRHRILLAEDDALSSTIIRDRLERLGHQVIQVEDGASVLRLAPKENPSLLILDVKMPFVDGFEVIRRLRSIRSMRKTPMMLVTSMGNEEDIARGFQLGADDYLVKPFSPIELEARVQRLLR